MTGAKHRLSPTILCNWCRDFFLPLTKSLPPFTCLSLSDRRSIRSWVIALLTFALIETERRKAAVLRRKTPQSVFWHERSPTRAAVEQMFADFRACKRKIWPRIKISRAHVTAGRVRSAIKWQRVSALNPSKALSCALLCFLHCLSVVTWLNLRSTMLSLVLILQQCRFFVRLRNMYAERVSAKKLNWQKQAHDFFISSPPPLLYIHNFLYRSIIASK